MSLATSGGLGGAGVGGGGGMAMAHHAHAVAKPAAPPPPPQGSVPPGTSTAPPPSVMSALAADLLDKNQGLSAKQVRNLSKYPLVGVDLYASDPIVALFPPKSKEMSDETMPELVGKIKSRVEFKTSQVAHKTLRKWLTKSKTYDSLRSDSLGPGGVTLDRPHQWLGVRRLKDVPSFVRDSFPSIEKDTPKHAIAEESSSSVGVTLANGTLDGISTPTGDDFDRVLYKVRLDDSKKSLAVLPEEAVALLLGVAQFHVARRTPQIDEEHPDEPTEYPVSIALPAWACHDASIEALLDATGGAGVVFHRGIAALAGALLPSSETNKVLERLNRVRDAKWKEKQRQQATGDAEDDGASDDYPALLVLVGMTPDGVECTAVQVSSVQPKILSCIYGNYKVLSNVSYQTPDPESLIEKCVSELYTNLEEIAPESDGAVGFVPYGTTKQQRSIKDAVERVRTTLDTWEKVPVFLTKPECVAMGLCVLGAVSHGRVAALDTSGNKSKAQLALRVQNVAPTAVGIRMNYHGGAEKKWTPVKVIFDFDRRVPAGPYSVELNAAECAALREDMGLLGEEALSASTKKYEGSKAIPKREEAALNLRVQVVQKSQREGEWMNVGDTMLPLVKAEGLEDEANVACERVSLQLSLGISGIITSNLVGERESVVQATVSARNSKLRYYIGIFLAVAFFGGFLIKSYVEERIFEHDTRRLLAYYKHVVPGSFNDGDEHNARYLVWKYKGKKHKLWRRLELKYGEPILQLHEYEELEKSLSEEQDKEDDVEDLDEGSDGSDSNPEGNADEPDL